MDIKQLKYFLTIAEEGQITSAAKKLNMAQPPLSQQLKLLEEELGVKLVERGSRHLKLTDTGKILMNRARQILELTNSAVKEVKDFSKGLQGTLSIGTVSSSGATLLNESVLEFHKEYSGIEFEIYEGIVRTPFNALNFECKYAKTEPMIAAIPREYYWEPAKYSISVSALKNKPLIIYRRFEQLICETCMEYGFEPQIFCKCDDARTALLWANAGAGIAIVPKSAFELAANSNLLYKEIENEKLKTKIAAIWVKDRYISPLASKFIESFGIV